MTWDIIFSLLTLTFLEIVLGIDNLIFIALVVEKLPRKYAKKARLIGLTLALGMRVIMLAGISWVMQLTEPLFTVLNIEFSFKDILLIAGGLFLIAKSTLEMHADLAGIEEKREMVVKEGFRAAVIQIVFIDLVFSFDSIITAVGLTNNLPIMITAIIISMIVMLIASDHISRFLKDHPTFKMLALAFILMIGTLLVAEGLGFHVPRGYVYFAFAFSIFVEAMNTAARKKQSRKFD